MLTTSPDGVPDGGKKPGTLPGRPPGSYILSVNGRIERRNNMAKKATASVSFKPLGDRAFVRFMEEMEKTASGLYIPDAAKEKPQKGIVEAVGKDVEEVKVGDIILFDKYAGSKINIDNVDYLIVKEDEILGILS